MWKKNLWIIPTRKLWAMVGPRKHQEMLRVLSHLAEFPCPKALPLLPSCLDQLFLSSNQNLSRVAGSFSGDLGL